MKDVCDYYYYYYINLISCLFIPLCNKNIKLQKTKTCKNVVIFWSQAWKYKCFLKTNSNNIKIEQNQINLKYRVTHQKWAFNDDLKFFQFNNQQLNLIYVSDNVKELNRAQKWTAVENHESFLKSHLLWISLYILINFKLNLWTNSCRNLKE